MDSPDAVLVVAWGNPLREDDAVAWHVLEGLRGLRPRPGLPPMRLRHAHQLAPEMADAVSRAAGVVFIDARADGDPGRVQCEPVRAEAGIAPLDHFLQPRDLLLIAQTVFGRAPRAALVSVGGERFGLGEGLSPRVRRAVPWAIRAVLRQAEAFAGEAVPV